jgi:hypothetical protein
MAMLKKTGGNAMAKKMLAAGIVALVMPCLAHASLLVDLRFTDGTKTKPIAAGTYQVDVWPRSSVQMLTLMRVS